MDFVAPGFLAAGLAVAVPVVIHLLFRTRARRIDLGSLRFLQQALRDHAHRRKLRRWLLLASRIAAVLLLAVLFARPFLRGQEDSGSGGEWLVAIDQSGSMSARADGQTRFDKAQELAGNLLKNAPEATALRVAYFDAGGVSVHSKAEPDPLRKPSVRGTDYGVPLKWARDILWRSKRPQRRLVLITDLQKSGLRSTGLPEFPQDVSIEVLDVGRPVPRNLAVTAAEVPLSEIRANHPVVVMAEVRNTGALPARGVAVRLSLTGPKAIELTQTLTVSAGSREQVRFEAAIDRPGLYQGSVSIAGQDELAFDDRRFLAFEARTADRVALINGKPAATPFAADTYFLEMALRLKPPDATAQPTTPFDPVTADYSPGLLGNLSSYSAVVLANVERLDPADRTSLRAWVEAGGRLLVFGGGDVDPAEYQADAESGLLPAKVLRIGDLSASRFQTWDRQHPLLANLSDPQHGDLRSISARRILELKPRPNAKVLVRDQSERPLLVEGKVGKGLVLFFALAADRDWGDWPTHRLFVPLIHQTFRYATGRLTPTSPIKSLNGDDRTGISQDGNGLTVRNPDPQESDVARVTEAAFRKAYNIPSAKPPPQDATLQLTRSAGTQKPSEIAERVVWILLALLLLETFLAGRTS